MIASPFFLQLRCAVAVGDFRCLPGLAACSTQAIEISNSTNNRLLCMCQILHWCAISGCIFLLWGRFWRICWGHQSFAHVSSTFRHRPGHLRLSADKPADASAMCGFFGRIFLVRQFQHPSTLQRQTSSENMSNHRRWLHRAAVRRPVRQPSRLQCF